MEWLESFDVCTLKKVWKCFVWDSFGELKPEETVKMRALVVEHLVDLLCLLCCRCRKKVTRNYSIRIIHQLWLQDNDYQESDSNSMTPERDLDSDLPQLDDKRWYDCYTLLNNCYWHWKWNWQPVFKSWMRLMTFHFMLISLGKGPNLSLLSNYV